MAEQVKSKQRVADHGEVFTAEREVKAITHHGNKVSEPMTRPLLEHGCDTFIRFNEAVGILHKVMAFNEPTMDSLVSSRQPFGLPTTFHGNKFLNGFDTTGLVRQVCLISTKYLFLVLAAVVMLFRIRY